MRARKPDRCLGPYANRPGRWVVFLVDGATGKKSPHFVPSEEAGQKLAAILRRDLEAQNRITVSQAIEEYAGHLKAKGNKPKSRTETIRRLKLFLEQELEIPVAAVERGKLVVRYEDLAKRLAADSSLNYLAEVKTFLRWGMEKRYSPRNPLAMFKPAAKRHHGKPQLRIDEARKFIAKAYQLADLGDQGAIAALLTLLLGLRASEITTREVRDVDDQGRVLWIGENLAVGFTPKTEGGRRRVEIPQQLQGYLRSLTKGREGFKWLFADNRGGNHWRDWPRKQVRRICVLAGVPMVSAHAMRGLHATLAVDAGISGQVVAQALGHESFRTTEQSYARQGSVEKAKHRKSMKALGGGKK